MGLFLGLRICRRCRPDMPPQMPTQLGISNAYSRQSCLTGQVLQMFLAWCVGSPRSGNQSRVGWCRQAACRIHSAGGAMNDAKSSTVIGCVLLQEITHLSVCDLVLDMARSVNPTDALCFCLFFRGIASKDAFLNHAIQ